MPEEAASIAICRAEEQSRSGDRSYASSSNRDLKIAPSPEEAPEEAVAI
jgi:hypothetical protein